MTRSFTRLAYPVVASLFVACGLFQVFLAGLGVFDDPEAFVTHRGFGYLFGWLTIVMLVIALVGRLPRRFTGLSVLLLVLFALQSVFVAVRVDMPAIAALHPVNGVVIIAIGMVAARASWLVRNEHAQVVPGVAAGDSLGAMGEAGG
jgi:hypothetical protein